MAIGGVLMLVLYLVVLGVIAYLIENYLPMPAVFKIVVRVIIVVFAILLLINFFVGYGPAPVLHR